MIHRAQYQDQVKDAVFGEPPWQSGTIQGELSRMDRRFVILLGGYFGKWLNENGGDEGVASVKTGAGMAVES